MGIGTGTAIVDRLRCISGGLHALAILGKSFSRRRNNVAGSFRDAMGLNELSAGLSGYCNYSRGMLWQSEPKQGAVR